ncbi:speckle-type POZ protein B-like [Stegodyphus dumicola]|uniref:speckle-type POZ protein B-like n=1 Tax=Stegodyphus dumicola TaxID=202533 RepID=UPI0015A963A7|nr:speckle-type POZ protein B-like [Stegodyphus dumicola]
MTNEHPYVVIHFHATELNASDEEGIECVPYRIDVLALSSLSRDMHALYENGNQSDFTLICGSSKIRGHKCILSARSPVFGRMFQHSITKTTDNAITIPDIDGNVLDQLVLFMYTGCISELSCPMARDLYSASDKYAVLQLKDKCTELLISSSSTSTAVEILTLGNTNNNIRIRNAAVRFYLRQFWRSEYYQSMA